MKSLEGYHPATVTVYFLTVTLISMLCMNPILQGLSLLGALLYWFSRKALAGWRTHLLFLLLFCGMALINPLLSHRGNTVLFFLNDAPITWEAIWYGIVAAIAILAVLYWFRSFTELMTSDRLLCLFGVLSPKLALVLSMALRYVPLFARRRRRIAEANRALGLYKDGNPVDRVRGGARVFSVMLTWSLENGIITADSMEARGYGCGKRSHFSLFRFCRADLFLLILTLGAGGIVAAAMVVGDLKTSFYPVFSMSPLTPLSWCGYFAYGILTLIPAALEMEEAIKWSYLKSKI